VIKYLPSPNFDERGSGDISLLVMHYTGMKSADEALQRLCDSNSQVSSHYVVDQDGTIYQLVDEDKRAWHAGISYWRGYKNVNNIAIGIEIVNKGHEFDYEAFPPVQMEAVASLALDIIKRHKILARNVVAHSDIAPTRKSDPGELFDWKFLAEIGVGLYPKESSQFEAGVEKLFDYGYEKAENNEHQQQIITAFQRHFRQAKLDGIWDKECATLLAQLLNMV